LKSVSPSFCLAKWLQVTIHLQNGLTHSCHHPNTHKVPLSEIKKDPSALHNTKEKKTYRKMMLEGERPKECQYCWNIEDTDSSNISDRYIKSNDDWAKPYFDEVASSPWNRNIDPKYLEVSFDSVCNFKCAYCAPHISTSWMQEVRKYGGYNTFPLFNDLKTLEASGQMPLGPVERQKYVDAFWAWWPKLYQNLRVFRVTGGEPLLSADTFKLLDYVDKEPNPNLSLAINSNLGVPDKIIEKFIKVIRPIIDERKVKDFTLFTSIDTYGPQAEYIRNGLNYNSFRANLELLLQQFESIQIVAMCTYNSLSVVGFTKLLTDLIEIRRKYKRSTGAAVVLDISYLRNPEFLSVKGLTKDFHEIQDHNLRVMNSLSEKNTGEVGVGFKEYEIDKLKRLTDWMKSEDHEDWWKPLQQANFYKFFSEHDRRRKTNFLETFPEMKTYWEVCQSLSQKK